MYFAGRGVARNEGQFIFWTRKAVEQGHAVAQANLGWAYEEGRGVGRDARLAASRHRPNWAPCTPGEVA